MKIATIPHIHVETTEITFKLPGSGFSKKKKKKRKDKVIKCIKTYAKGEDDKREEKNMHILYK